MNKVAGQGVNSMTNEPFTCALEGCDTTGIKTTHNQKYCSGDHCKQATNAKILERYHERNAIKQGKKRFCATCETTILSSYNMGKTCAGCDSAREVTYASRIEELKSLVA